jgi:hypothetical protein
MDVGVQHPDPGCVGREGGSQVGGQQTLADSTLATGDGYDPPDGSESAGDCGSLGNYLPQHVHSRKSLHAQSRTAAGLTPTLSIA